MRASPSCAQRLPAELEVVVVDATDPAQRGLLRARPGRGQTLVLLGSSGAGKSTLTNTLLGAARAGHRRRARPRQPRHAHDDRALAASAAGRRLHHRHAGSAHARARRRRGALAASFGDVESLAARCRFRDCSHAGEPGCAVREGVDPDRLRNFQKMLRETRRDTLSWIERRQQLSAWKSRGQEARVRIKMKRGAG